MAAPARQNVPRTGTCHHKPNERSAYGIPYGHDQATHIRSPQRKRSGTAASGAERAEANRN